MANVVPHPADRDDPARLITRVRHQAINDLLQPRNWRAQLSCRRSASAGAPSAASAAPGSPGPTPSAERATSSAGENSRTSG